MCTFLSMRFCLRRVGWSGGGQKPIKLAPPFGGLLGAIEMVVDISQGRGNSAHPFVLVLVGGFHLLVGVQQRRLRLGMAASGHKKKAVATHQSCGVPWGYSALGGAMIKAGKGRLGLI